MKPFETSGTGLHPQKPRGGKQEWPLIIKRPLSKGASPDWAAGHGSVWKVGGVPPMHYV